MSFLSILGLAPDEEDKRVKELKALVKGSYKNVKVVGRGTIRIDPIEVSRSEEFINARKKARQLVKNERAR